MGCAFDEGSKSGLVGLPPESREAALRVNAGPPRDPVAVSVIRIRALDDLRFGNSIDQSKSKDEGHVEASPLGSLIGKRLSFDATRLKYRRSHDPNVFATSAA